MDEQEMTLEAQEEAAESVEGAAETPAEELERLRAELDISRSELDKGWEVLRQERRLDMLGRELEKRGIGAGFAPFIIRESDEATAAALEEFEALFRECLSRAVTERMRGGLPPRAPKRAVGYRRDDLSSLSRREINEHWDEIVRSLTGNDF